MKPVLRRPFPALLAAGAGLLGLLTILYTALPVRDGEGASALRMALAYCLLRPGMTVEEARRIVGRMYVVSHENGDVYRFPRYRGGGWRDSPLPRRLTGRVSFYHDPLKSNCNLDAVSLDFENGVLTRKGITWD